jgi:hypothetical protein
MRTLVFVDEANFQKSAYNAGFRPDLVALRDYLRDGGRRELIEMVVYIGLPPERRAEDMPENWQRAFNTKHRLRHALENHGIMVVSWRGKQLFGYDPPRFAANIDMLMAMDALEFALEARPDTVVLVTGDGADLRRSVHQSIDLSRFFDEHTERVETGGQGERDWDDQHDDDDPDDDDDA